MLRVENLEFSYRNSRILKGITFELEKGVGCLLGPNGAGKSTLLKCIAGILRPQSGKIELDGTDLVGLSFRERARLVSYAPQEFSINFPYTVFEVVLMGRSPHANLLTGPGDEDEEKTMKALRALGIEELKDRPFTSLSGGQKRLVLIARALAQGGRLIIFDEPTSFLDFKNQLLVLSVIEKIAKKLGKLVLLSLHDPNLALLFCDEVFLMKEGKVLMHGKAEDVINEDTMSILYNLRVRLVNVDGQPIVVPEKEKHGKI
ncbi:ABC transporter ATP-binding protein [Thermococcus sp. GR7]|uniref:ABC transporter ATP-binding protein n=1 Tax=unclassified Thermococcus TaxID=2627626 RepID=UPI00142FACCF|nr:MULTISPECIES: ABC transporter ATP-binding protein [unclassified Thermococcus]NJE46276.1 ABC transporter ATP-binding protein [Thermococcus sp. GR7]NJE79226.1 ABC transporter ATP-binding protein [Thermococcus sp. GR4]NJF23845.1 ABC transporter ATP-binding protein [Thermococcus sp. GR5]